MAFNSSIASLQETDEALKAENFKIDYTDFIFYKQLKEALKPLESQNLEKKIAELSLQAPALKLLNKGQEVLVLKEILSEKGYLKEDAKTDIFDESLEKAVKIFQRDNSLTQDGIVGRVTKKFLNRSLKSTKEIIQKNIDRWEKLTSITSKKFIIVNVAAYEVYVFDLEATNGEVKPYFKIDAIVGRRDRKTPLFFAPLTQVTFNPVWNVPASIAKKDKFPKIKIDPDYLRRAHLTVLDSLGSVVDPQDMDLDDFSSYRLRQSSGAYNALGVIKFSLDTLNAIYMHDTPDKKLFDKQSRALSSGCIRLKEPSKMAQWVLQGTTFENEEVLQKAIESGKTKTLRPEQPIPVEVVYLTCWVDEKGNLVLSDDPYGYDDKL